MCRLGRNKQEINQQQILGLHYLKLEEGKATWRREQEYDHWWGMKRKSVEVGARKIKKKGFQEEEIIKSGIPDWSTRWDSEETIGFITMEFRWQKNCQGKNKDKTFLERIKRDNKQEERHSKK